MNINVNDTTCDINAINDAVTAHNNAAIFSRENPHASSKENPFIADADRLDLIAFKGARSAMLVCDDCGRCVNVPLNARGEHATCENTSSFMRGVSIHVSSSRDLRKLDN
jgi:hypothetical protein